MTCTRVLHILSPRGSSPVAPVDMAVSIFLGTSPPLCAFLGNYDKHLAKHFEPLQPCLSNITMATKNSTSTSPALISNLARLKRKKKSVVFADSRGLALTAVHVFSKAEDSVLSELQFRLTEIEGTTAGLNLVDDTEAASCGSRLFLQPDFSQPAADYLDLRNRLRLQQVCLETCSIQDRVLSGTVQVRNLSFEKSVLVRITFDSWCSFRDFPGLYLNNIYGCPDIDTFSFSVLLPEVLEPFCTVEFCIQYQTQDQIFWDNNYGKNYRLALVDPNRSQAQSTESSLGLKIQRGCSGEGIEFDPFGSPRTSAGIFPEWQSWCYVENSTPYW